VAEADQPGLRALSGHVKGALDFLDGLRRRHIRRLFAVFGTLAHDTAGGGRLDDEVHIHIRKLLSDPRPRCASASAAPLLLLHSFLPGCATVLLLRCDHTTCKDLIACPAVGTVAQHGDLTAP
jgi:hypothetical protein